MGIGGVALGYNVGLNDTVEVVTQVYLDLPQSEESPLLGVMFGFIVTVPPS